MLMQRLIAPEQVWGNLFSKLLLHSSSSQSLNTSVIGNKLSSPESALQRLISGNQVYIDSATNPADISTERTVATARDGQAPYAVVVTCSDSRVPPEHLFSAGVGDLFVIRTAGNVIGDFELGSIEYAVQHLQVPVVVIMGHSHCGAVSAAMAGQSEGYLGTVIAEIQNGLGSVASETEAIRNNIEHSRQRVLQSVTVRSLLETGDLLILTAEYDLETRQVTFFDSGGSPSEASV